MLRRSQTQLLHQVQQLCGHSAVDGSLEALQSLPCRLQTCSLGLSYAQARGAASSTGPNPHSSSSAAAFRQPSQSPAAAAAAAAAASTSGSAETPLSFLARQQQGLASIPPFPKLLGFAGAIPFLTLTPSFVEAAGFSHLIDYCAQMQLVYGGSIVTFLGAVHWGLAMNSATLAAAGSKAASALNERYVWSVVPSLAVVPALLMQPAQGSFSISVLLAICYVSDASYFRSGYLPAWYMSLRGYLTLLAMTGMLSTTWYYLQKDLAKAKKLMEEEDAKRLARLEARTAAAGAGAAAAVAAQGTAAAAQQPLAGRR